MRLALVLLLASCAPPVEEAPCSTGSRGVDVGELLIDPPPLRRCDGGEVQLSELTCGAQLTLVDVGAASFRTCVEATASYVEDPAYLDLRARGLQVVQIFTTDAQLQPADLDFCALYSETHAIDFEFLIDPFAYSDAFGPIHPLSVAVDGEGIVVERWEGEIPEDQAAVLAGHL